MPYRGRNPARQRAQIENIHMQAGFTATWRRFVSADDGIAVMGIEGSAYYSELTITAQIGAFGTTTQSEEQQSQAGMIAAGRFPIVTREEFGTRDEFKWRGDTYRIESNSIPAPISNQWITIVKRGN